MLRLFTRLINCFPTFDGDPAGDDVPDFTGDVTGVFLGDPLPGEAFEGSALISDGGGKSVHEEALGAPKVPCAIDP